MARKTSKFMIGLFVIVGVLIGMVAVIWLGASKYFEKGKTYVTFFDESVQGLQVDSAVKYRGVEVGRVEAIRVAPDNKLIEVVVKINLKGKLEQDYVSQLKAAGITGIVFIELDRKDPGKPDFSPKINFAAEYPIVSSQPSDIKQILGAVENVIDKIKQIDTQGISDQIKTTTKEIGDIVASENMRGVLEGAHAAVDNLNGVIGKVDQALSEGRIEAVLSEAKNSMLKLQTLIGAMEGEIRSLNLSKTGANLESATAKLDGIIGSGEIEAILAETRGTIAKAQATIDSLQNQIGSLQVSETIVKVNRMIERMDSKSEVLTRDVVITSETLRRTLESLQALIDRLSASPSDILFSKPPPPLEVK
jgi:phospholipid/cholesterol/gamma-HCH transport system substrate-binding protein